MESRARASGEQFSTLLKFMESHGDLGKPQPGAQGRLRADRLWQELANTLNSVGGVRKTTDKWKKVWADWKSKTKKKSLTRRQHSRGTGGGPNTNVTLTALEDRLIAIIGVQAVKGHAGIEEQGFNIPAAATSQSLPESIYSDLEIGTEDIAISQYEVPPPLATSSASRTQPSPEPVGSATLSGASRQRRRRQLAAPLGPAARISPTRATSPLPPVPTTPPPSNSASPHSSVATSHHRHLRTRRRRTLTPFDRATSEFVAIEQRRLQLEERRAQTEARRVEVDNERNNLLSRFANIAEAFLQQYLDRARDCDFTVLDSD